MNVNAKVNKIASYTFQCNSYAFKCLRWHAFKIKTTFNILKKKKRYFNISINFNANKINYLLSVSFNLFNIKVKIIVWINVDDQNWSGLCNNLTASLFSKIHVSIVSDRENYSRIFCAATSQIRFSVQKLQCFWSWLVLLFSEEKPNSSEAVLFLLWILHSTNSRV